MSAPAIVDQAVRDEIRDAVDRNMLVEAGAGTGKTTSLVGRIVEILRTGQADVDGLGAVTFTNKAATELSARVREALEDSLETETDAGARERLAAAARGLYRARIETIHSFATDLLRERPVEAGLDPEFRALTDLESQLLFDEVFGDWLAEMLAGDRPEIATALNLGAGPDQLRAIAEVINRHRFLLPLAEFPALEADGSELTAWLDQNLPVLQGIADRCTDADDKGLAQIQKVLDFAERLRVEGTTPEATARLIATAAPGVNLGAGAKGNWPDPGELAGWKGEIGPEYKELADRVPREMRAAALAGVIPLVARFAQDFAERRRRDGKPDFDDLIVWARDLVRDRAEVRRYFQGRFQALLIDEFQDTDPAQVELAIYLTTDADAGDKWRELAPAPGKLFVVGDPKQSIYRFRRADIGIYDEVKAGALAGGYREIVQNFRSVRGILDWVNATFDRLFEQAEGLQPANVHLAATHDPADDRHPPVVVVRGSYPDANADELRGHESEAIAAVLHGAVAGAEPWLVRDPAGDGARPAEWRDVGILLPARTGLEAFEQALTAAGIPFRHEGSRDYFQREEVRDLIFMLRAIDDPRDRISLVGALRSGAFGCSDDDLAIHAGTATEGSRWDYRFDQESDAERVIGAFEVLRGLHSAREKLSLPLLVQRVLAESHLVEAALLRPDGAQGAANLLAIVDQARSFSAAGGGGPRAFIRWLVENTERETQEVDAGIAEETDNVVRIMTMHGAKGLEFPITVLGNLGAASPTDRRAVADEASSRLHFSIGSREDGFATPGYEERWEQESRAYSLEGIRLLYVAATRARDFLIVPEFTGKRAPGPMLKTLQPHLPEESGHEVESDGVWLLDAAQVPRPAPVTEKGRRVADGETTSGVSARDAWADSHEALIAESRTGIGMTVASSVKRSIRPLASEASHSEAAMLVSEGPPLEIGDALHKLMEIVSLPGAEDLEPLAASICTEFGIPDAEGDVVEMARRCLASDAVKAAIGSDWFDREVPFTLVGEAGYTVGRVDLVYREADGTLVIVDYKSDEVAGADCEAHADEHYSGQAETYAGALGGLAGAAQTRVVFVYARSGTEVALTPS